MKTLECVITDLTVTSLLFNNRKFYMSKQFMLSKSHEMNREGSNDILLQGRRGRIDFYVRVTRPIWHPE